MECLIPGFESNGKIYSTLLDVQNDGRSGENEIKTNVELADNSPAKLLKVGDYVDYVPDSKTYTPDASILGKKNSALSTESAVWRVWSVNKATGEVMISPETSVNEFKMCDTPSEKFLEIEKICKELYSNSGLNLEAHLLTDKDILKAIGYVDKEENYVTSRRAYFLTSDGVENGTTVTYKGEEYRVQTYDECMFTDEEIFESIEGGEITTDTSDATRDGQTQATAWKLKAN